jgi:hypothetical protein
MDFALLIPLLGIFFIIGVPIMSVAAHFVLRPLIRDLTGAIKGDRQNEEESLERRLSRVEEMLLDQNRQIDQLVDAELFRRRLEAGEAVGTEQEG